MTDSPLPRDGLPLDELRALADAACDGKLSPAEAARLEALLRGNAAAQQFYLACVRLDGCLRWEFGNRAQGERKTRRTSTRSGKTRSGQRVRPPGFRGPGQGFTVQGPPGTDWEMWAPETTFILHLSSFLRPPPILHLSSFIPS